MNMTYGRHRRFLLAMFAALGLAFGATACGSSSSSSSAPAEVEDCDYDDLIEGDSDCYGDAGKKSKSKSTKPKKLKKK